MPWTKLDDKFHQNRKIRRAWVRCPRAVGLYVMSMTYSNENLLDGFVDPEWVREQLPNPKDRDETVRCLVDLGMWDEFGDGWEVHDYLEYNPSKAEVEHRREMRRIAGKLGAIKTNGKAAR